MCLNNPVEARTGNKLYTRYKTVRISGDELYTPYTAHIIDKQQWQDIIQSRRIIPGYDSTGFDGMGYHVYVDIRAAQKIIQTASRYDRGWRIVKIQTRYRVATGDFANWKSEIWRTYKILKFVGTKDAKRLNKEFGYK